MASSTDISLVKRKITRYIKTLRLHHVEPLKVYLFGSYASGKAREHSDIDLAVVAECLSGHPVNDFVQLMKLRRKIDYRIEPHPFRPEDFTEDNPEAAEIMRTGIRII